MIDINEINDTIRTLEAGDTTYENCMKLASLYTVRNHLADKATETELNDILPQYRKYCNIKRKYYFDEVAPDAVYQSLDYLCMEIQEFLDSLYTGTSSQNEREILKNMLENVYKKHI